MKNILLLLSLVSLPIFGTETLSSKGQIKSYEGEFKISTLKISDFSCLFGGNPCSYAIPGLSAKDGFRQLVRKGSSSSEDNSTRVSETIDGVIYEASLSIGVPWDKDGLYATLYHYCNGVSSRKSLLWALKALPANIPYQFDSLSHSDNAFKELGGIESEYVEISDLQVSDFSCDQYFSRCTYPVSTITKGFRSTRERMSSQRSEIKWKDGQSNCLVNAMLVETELTVYAQCDGYKSSEEIFKQGLEHLPQPFAFYVDILK